MKSVWTVIAIGVLLLIALAISGKFSTTALFAILAIMALGAFVPLLGIVLGLIALIYVLVTNWTLIAAKGSQLKGESK